VALAGEQSYLRLVYVSKKEKDLKNPVHKNLKRMQIEEILA
jgi:hypothetical protein